MKTEPTVLEVIENDNWLWEPGEIKVVPLGRPATIDDLRRTKLKAEIVNGEMQVIGPSGGGPAIAAGNIIFSLHLYEERQGGGCVYMSRLAYLVDLPHRQAICPDVSWYTGPTGITGYPTAHRYSPSKCAIGSMTAMNPSGGWRRSGRTTSRRGRRWCGMWTRWPRS